MNDTSYLASIKELAMTTWQKRPYLVALMAIALGGLLYTLLAA